MCVFVCVCVSSGIHVHLYSVVLYKGELPGVVEGFLISVLVVCCLCKKRVNIEEKTVARIDRSARACK